MRGFEIFGFLVWQIQQSVIYINIEKLGVDSSKLIGQILSKTGVALTPGIDFDRNSGSKTLRLSFSADTNTFRSGLKILKKWYQENY